MTDGVAWLVVWLVGWLVGGDVERGRVDVYAFERVEFGEHDVGYHGQYDEQGDFRRRGTLPLPCPPNALLVFMVMVQCSCMMCRSRLARSCTRMWRSRRRRRRRAGVGARRIWGLMCVPFSTLR